MKVPYTIGRIPAAVEDFSARNAPVPAPAPDSAPDSATDSVPLLASGRRSPRAGVPGPKTGSAGVLCKKGSAGAADNTPEAAAFGRAETPPLRLPREFTDPSMVLMTRMPHPAAGPAPDASQYGLDALLDHWDDTCGGESLFESIEFDPTLANDCFGVSLPGGSRIGTAAFNATLRAVAGLHANGEATIQLGTAMTTVQVMATVLHESTHLQQFDRYPYIDQDAHHDDFAALPLVQQAPLFGACMAEMSVFETLAYQCEVVNLVRFGQQHAAYLAARPAEQLQLEALRDTALDHRDIHFSRLSPPQRRLMAAGRVTTLLAEIHADVPRRFIVDPGKSVRESAAAPMC